MTRHFYDGWQEEVDGIWFRAVAGYKGPDDLRLEWYRSGEWWPVSMVVGAMMADFFCENEDYLYPPGQGHQGRAKYLTYLARAAQDGHKQANQQLMAEKVNKRSREQQAS